MRLSILRVGVISALAFSTLTACDYEFKDDPQGAKNDSSADEDEDEDEEDAQVERKPDIRPTLAPGKDYSGSSTLPAGAKRIDLLNLAATNQATLTLNIPNEKPDNLFDGADDSIVRTPDINPLETTISFTAPTKIKALRVRSTYSDFAIAIQIDGGERLIIDHIPDGDWGTVVFAAPVTAKKVFVQILRKVRDNFVHANEIEIYQ